MEITLSNHSPVINSDKKLVTFDASNVLIDGLLIEMPGEYEKSGILAHTIQVGDSLLTELQVERKSIGYIPASITDATEDLVGFFGDLDLLLIAGSKDDVKIFESIESRAVLPYSEMKDSFLTALGQ